MESFFHNDTNISTGNVGLSRSNSNLFGHYDSAPSGLPSDENQIHPVLSPSTIQLNGPRSGPDSEDAHPQRTQLNGQGRTTGSRIQQNHGNQEDQPNPSMTNSVGGAGIVPPVEEQKDDAAANKSPLSLLGVTKSKTGNWLELTSLVHDVTKKAKQDQKKKELLAESASLKNIWLKIRTLHFQDSNFNNEIKTVFDLLIKRDNIKLDFIGFEENDFYWRQIILSLQELLHIVFSGPSLEITTLAVIWNFRHDFGPKNAAHSLIEFISKKLSAITKLTDFSFVFRSAIKDEYFQEFLNGLQAIEQKLKRFELETTLKSFQTKSHLNLPIVEKCILKLSFIGDFDIPDPITPKNSLIKFIADSLEKMVKINELEIELITEYLDIEEIRPIFAALKDKRNTLRNLKIMISITAITEENDLALQLRKLIKCAAEELTDSKLWEVKFSFNKTKHEGETTNKRIVDFFCKKRDEIISEIPRNNS